MLAKTADRSVLGCMNDMAFRCEHAIADAGGLARTDSWHGFRCVRAEAVRLGRTAPLLPRRLSILAGCLRR